MSILRTFETRCASCGWEGQVSLGDVRSGPWRKPDGSLFYKELICPQCEEQVVNPFGEHNERFPLPTLTPETEDGLKAWERMQRRIAASKRARHADK
jgi:hypothetical protein